MCYAKINEPPSPSVALVDSATPSDISHPDVMKDYSQVGEAMVTLSDIMQTFIEMAYGKFCQMSDQMDAARTAQTMVNHIKTVMSQLEKPDQIGILPAEVMNYLRENNLLVDEQTIDDFLYEKARIGRVVKEGQFYLFSGLTAAALKSIETVLESFVGQASDIVQHSQLKLMELMKDFNTALTMTRSVQSTNAASVKSIEQSIR